MACKGRVLTTGRQRGGLAVDPLTVEGLGADLAVRSGHATAMTRRGDEVTLHALHLLRLCASGQLLVSRRL